MPLSTNGWRKVTTTTGTVTAAEKKTMASTFEHGFDPFLMCRADRLVTN